MLQKINKIMVKHSYKFADESFVENYKKKLHGGRQMVHPGMVGITELMMDENFLCWMERQQDDLLESLTTFEIFNLYQSIQ